MYRTGKSYLLNRMILNRAQGFGVGPSINPCTKGLWMWGSPLIGQTPEGRPVSVVVVDSEGIGGLDEDEDHDIRIFSLAVLLASQNQIDKAREALELAVRANPDYATAQENLGDLYAKLASLAYIRALQLEPGNAALAPKLALIRQLLTGGAKPNAAVPLAPAGPTPASTPSTSSNPSLQVPAPATKP